MTMKATHILVNDNGTYALSNPEATTDAIGGPALRGWFAPLLTVNAEVMEPWWLQAGLFPLDSSTTIIPITPKVSA